MKLFAGINGDTDLENRLTDTVDGGEEGEGGMDGERNMETGEFAI